MRQGRPKRAQPASKVSLSAPKWAHLRLLLPTLEALLPTLDALWATWGVRLRIFMHFCKVFVNNCAFFLKIRGNLRKIMQLALKFVSIAQKHRKRP